MNYDNLARIRDAAGTWVTVQHGDVRLFCDGKVIALAGDWPVGGADSGEHHRSTMEMGAPKMWDGMLANLPTENLIAGGLFGHFGCYHRDLGDGVRKRVHVIQERYARCFTDPQFYLGKVSRTGMPIVVFENSRPVGIVMEMRFDPKYDYPEVPYLADDVLYHVCECSHDV